MFSISNNTQKTNPIVNLGNVTRIYKLIKKNYETTSRMIFLGVQNKYIPFLTVQQPLSSDKTIFMSLKIELMRS